MSKDSFFQMPEDEAKALLNALANNMKHSYGVLVLALEQIYEASESIGDAHDAWHYDTLQKLVLVLRDQHRTEPRDEDL